MYSFLEMPAKIYIQSRPNLLEFSALKPKSYNQSIDNINLPNLHALFKHVEVLITLEQFSA